MDRRRLLLGDWHPWMRDPIDLLRALLLAGAAGFALAGDWRGAGLVAGAGVVAWLVRLAWLPRVYDLAIVLALALQAGGEAFRLYDSVLWFDNVVHFTLPFFAGPTLYIVLARLDVVPDPKDETHLHHYIGIAIVAFALGVTIGALWELVEWFLRQPVRVIAPTRQRRHRGRPRSRLARLAGRHRAARVLGPVGLGLRAAVAGRQPRGGNRGRVTPNA